MNNEKLNESTEVPVDQSVNENNKKTAVDDEPLTGDDDGHKSKKFKKVNINSYI